MSIVERGAEGVCVVSCCFSLLLRVVGNGSVLLGQRIRTLLEVNDDGLAAVAALFHQMVGNSLLRGVAGRIVASMRYRILEPIGNGGRGEVFLAEDTELERKIALEFLPEAF